MKIVFTDFKGLAPKFDSKQLADGYSVQSVNTRPGRNILEAWRDGTTVETLTATNYKSIFKYNNEWFSWVQDDVYAVRVPLTNDPWDYVLIANPTNYPQITEATIAETGVGPYPAATRRIGVPAPPTPVVTSVDDNPGWVMPDPRSD